MHICTVINVLYRNFVNLFCCNTWGSRGKIQSSFLYCLRYACVMYDSFYFIRKKNSKNKDNITHNGEVICTFVVLPHRPRFQTEAWIRTIRGARLSTSFQTENPRYSRFQNGFYVYMVFSSHDTFENCIQAMQIFQLPHMVDGVNRTKDHWISCEK